MQQTQRHSTPEPASSGRSFQLCRQQIEFFNTFGFLKLPGLFADEAELLQAGFDDVFANNEPDNVLTHDPLQETDNTAFRDRKRSIIYNFIERTDKLRWLSSDFRVLGIVRSIMGSNYELRPTDGHVFDCDTSWHPDTGFGSDERFRLKLSFYLDPQRADSGAIRVLPGSHLQDGPYAKTLWEKLYGSPHKIRANYGVEAHEIPAWTIESDPGDLIFWNFRTFHATFHGFERRRLFSLTFRAADPETAS